MGYEEAIEQKESDIVRTLVHQLRPTLLGIDLQVKSFKRIVKKYNLTDKKEFDNNYLDNDPELEGIINKPENNTFGNLIERLESDTLHLNNVLNTVNDVMNFNINHNDKEKTDIFDFIEDYSKQHLEKEKEYTVLK